MSCVTPRITDVAGQAAIVKTIDTADSAHHFDFFGYVLWKEHPVMMPPPGLRSRQADLASTHTKSKFVVLVAGWVWGWRGERVGVV